MSKKITLGFIAAVLLAGLIILIARRVESNRKNVQPVGTPDHPPKAVVQAEPKPKKLHDPDVGPVPTPQDVVEKMLEVAQVKKSDLVYDLGCGDGRIVVTAAKKYGCKAVGYDIEYDRVIESLENVKKNNVENLVTIEQEDVFTLDISKADVITLFLLPELNVRLIPQLETLKPGSRIVSQDFDMEGVTPDKVVTIVSNETGSPHLIYLWTTPLKKEAKIDNPEKPVYDSNS